MSDKKEFGNPLRLGKKLEGKKTKEQSLIHLPLPNCIECPIHLPNSIKHNYRGSVPARILLMGEAPGATEQQVGQVFRGRAGQLLSSILEETGFDEDNEVFICNTLLCSPPDNRKPKSAELKCCTQNIEAIIDAVKPEVIVPIGNIALKWLTKRSGIMTWHGTKIDSPYGQIIPAIHPAYALKNGAKIHPKRKAEQMEGIRGFIVTDFKYIRSVLDGTEQEFEKKKTFDYRLISSIKKLEEVFEQIEQHTDVAVDIETTGLNFYRDQIIGIGFSWEEGQGVYIPLMIRVEDLENEDLQKYARIRKLNSIYPKALRKRDVKTIVEEPKYEITKKWYAKKNKKGSKKTKRSQIPLISYWGKKYQEDVNKLLAAILELPNKRWYGWNFKFDAKFIVHHLKTDVFPLAEDGLYQAFLLDENSPNDLKSNTDVYISEMRGYANQLRQQVSQSELDDEKLANVSLPILYRYCCGDVDATLRLCKLQNEKLAQESKLKDLYYHDFYLELHKIYTEAEMEGILVDPDWVNKIGEEKMTALDQLEEEMFEMVGEDFNPNSDQQISKLIYGEDSYFKIPLFREKQFLTETGNPSVKELVLKEIFYNSNLNSEISGFVRLLLEHRKYSKQMSTYIIGCTEELDDFGRAHWHANLIGATTGRLSYKRIPIQTIPRDSSMRGMFIPAPGWKIIEADYSQVELRIAAWYSQDPVMMWEFANNEDVHTNTAAAIFKVEKDQVTKDQRKYAKGTNFGSLYESGSRTLADSMNDKIELDEVPVTLNEAEKFQKVWKERYRGFVEWRYKIHHATQKNLQVQSPLGRIRRLPASISDDNKERSEALRQGPNSLIQGLGSDLGEFALIRIYKRIKEEGLHARFRWSLHDALFIEAPDCEIIRICEIMKEEMERPMLDGLYTPIELKVFKDRWAGEYWEDFEEIKKIFKSAGPIQPYSSMLKNKIFNPSEC